MKFTMSSIFAVSTTIVLLGAGCAPEVEPDAVPESALPTVTPPPSALVDRDPTLPIWVYVHQDVPITVAIDNNKLYSYEYKGVRYATMVDRSNQVHYFRENALALNVRRSVNLSPEWLREQSGSTTIAKNDALSSSTVIAYEFIYEKNSDYSDLAAMMLTKTDRRGTIRFSSELAASTYAISLRTPLDLIEASPKEVEEMTSGKNKYLPPVL
jgi:hypothetical protein